MHPKRYRRLLSAFCSTPWAILPEKLDEIATLIELKANGHITSEAEVRSAMAQKVEREVEAGEGTALLAIHGTITHRANAFSSFSGGTSTELFGKAFRAAMNDDDIGRIVIDGETPGGAVPGNHELSSLIYNAREEKEIITVAGGVMASAGYWNGSAAGRVVAIPSAVSIGSIGAIFMHSMIEDENETVTVLRSVDMKARFNSLEKPTQEAIEHQERKMAQIHEMFVADVARNRGVSVERVNSDFGQGGTFMAADALSAGLVDEIATLEEVLAEPIRRPSDTTVVSAGVPGSKENVDVKLSAKLKVALVQAGLCGASATAADFLAALELFCEASKIAFNAKATELTNEEEILKAFASQRTLAPPVDPTSGGQGGNGNPTRQRVGGDDELTAIRARMADLLPQANDIIGISAIPPAERQTTLATVQAGIQAGTITNHGQMLEAISEAQQSVSVSAGPAHQPAVTADAADKMEDAATVAIMRRCFAADAIPESYVTRNGRTVTIAEVETNRQLSRVPRMIEEMAVAAHGPGIVRQRSDSQLVFDFFGGNLGASVTGIPAYNTTGMFQNVLYNATRVQAFREYQLQAPEYRSWCPDGGALRDFGVFEFKSIGMLTSPKVIGENGEFSDATYIGTEAEQVRLGLWGYRYGYTWQMALADDLKFFTKTQQKMIHGIGVKEDNIVHEYLLSNPVMKDHTRLFDASRNNLLRYTGQVCYTEKIVREVRKTLYHQTDVGHDDARDGDVERLQFPFRRILQPLCLADQSTKYFDSASPEDAPNSNVRNPHSGIIPAANRTSIGLLDALAGGHDFTWYAQTDPNRAEWISWHNLEGFSEPQIMMKESDDRLAIHLLCFKPFGVSAKDFRGVVMVQCDQAAGAGVGSPT